MQSLKKNDFCPNRRGINLILESFKLVIGLFKSLILIFRYSKACKEQSVSSAFVILSSNLDEIKRERVHTKLQNGEGCRQV